MHVRRLNTTVKEFNVLGVFFFFHINSLDRHSVCALVQHGMTFGTTRYVSWWDLVCVLGCLGMLAIYWYGTKTHTFSGSC